LLEVGFRGIVVGPMSPISRALVGGCAGVLLVLALPGTAAARLVRYRGIHPLPAQRGGFCHLEVGHVHPFIPSEPRVFRVVGDEQVFVGDPVAFGYDGPKYTYYGPHPLVRVEIDVAGEPVFCYLGGAHYHAAAPPATAGFELKSGVYWYMGAFAPVFEQHQRRYAVVNEVRPVVTYTAPVVDIAVAPPGFHARVMLAAPVAPPPPAPPPRARVEMHIVAPPPPSVQIGFGLQLGGGATVVERERVIIRDRRGPGPRWKPARPAPPIRGVGGGPPRGWHKKRHGDR
jgi:hypothetical protein